MHVVSLHSCLNVSLSLQGHVLIPIFLRFCAILMKLCTIVFYLAIMFICAFQLKRSITFYIKSSLKSLFKFDLLQQSLLNLFPANIVSVASFKTSTCNWVMLEFIILPSISVLFCILTVCIYISVDWVAYANNKYILKKVYSLSFSFLT